MIKLLLVAAVVAGCSKQDAASGGSCKPLAVTVDGQPLAAMPHGGARSNNMNGDISYEVQMFNHAKTTCEQMISKNGRTIPEGEISVRAFAGGAGMTGTGIGIDAHTQMGGNVSLASAKPKANGDVVKICVDNATFKPIAGAYKDKQVSVTGLFEAKYCGELTW